MMKKLFILFLISIAIAGCKPIDFQGAIAKSEKFDLKRYDIYTFKLRLTNSTSDQDPQAPIFKNGVDADRGLIYEMLYLLRNRKNDSIIYFTTRSHKYIRDGGVFNHPLYEDHLIMNDLDYLYFGKEESNKIIFYDPNGRTYVQNPTFYFSENNDIITIDSITNNYANEKSRQAMRNLKIEDDVLGISLKFKKENKSYVYAYTTDNFNRNGLIADCHYIYVNDNDVFLEVNSFEDTWYDAYIDKVKMFRQ